MSPGNQPLVHPAVHHRGEGVGLVPEDTVDLVDRLIGPNGLPMVHQGSQVQLAPRAPSSARFGPHW